jgi:hypothetical protein
VTDEAPWFRVRARLPVAFELADPAAEAPALPAAARPAADAARAVVARIDRADTGLRDVGRALLEAIDHLAAEVERLRVRLDLSEGGVDLAVEGLELGGDGLHLDRRLPVTPGTHLRVWMELRLDGQVRLVAAIAQVLPSPEGTALRFTGIRPEARDRIVAYAFKHQAQERRRDRDRAR